MPSAASESTRAEFPRWRNAAAMIRKMPIKANNFFIFIFSPPW